ncbi:sulfotransferase family protein [Vibrio brasiliensis]|uniref:Sulfotransferase n=1 Tax=Vibrio brasiliensis LMG 20546 TaxID=945543 RepID=E8LUA4_9VIBR|nr:sulfotransferase [Vibrio brasiliensis]EGA65769.1 hypothetical protein VIBR0546_21840 [Vibrio brasiliensis LMG 20546]
MSNGLGLYLSTGLSVALFLVLIFCFQLPLKVRQLGNTILSVLVMIGDISLNDEQKESQVQLLTIRLAGRFLLLVISMVLVFALPFLLMYLLEKVDIAPMDQVVDLMVSLPFLLVSTLIGALVWGYVKLTSKNQINKVGKGFEVRYSRTEKALHLIAFATRDIQAFISKLEDKLWLKSDSGYPSQPVFITAMPRAGTTLLMELCFNTGRFATHTYRDMPFVLLPLLWRKFSQRFMKKSSEVERAHGDGMLVSLDSPEAFEEILWMTYWHEQYHNQHISPWPSYRTSRFDDFFARHQRKITTAASDQQEAKRYLSKNNLNIARVEFLLKMNPQAKIVIPFRQPAKHCQSLLRQHLNFLDIHQQDEFSRVYMAGIGHFDFGENLKPVNFDQWLSGSSSKSAESLAYWYEYWCACYQHLLKIESDRVCFVDFDKLCQQPEHELNRIADFIGLDDRTLLVKQAGLLQARDSIQDDYHGLEPELVTSIVSTYDKLKSQATKELSYPDSQ